MTKTYQLQSTRLYFRPFVLSDAPELYALDSNPNVHRYLGRSPLTDVAQAEAVIRMILEKYDKWGIGRYATFIRETSQFIGWSGLSWAEQPVYGDRPYYDLGYRLMEEYWGKGYGAEAAQAWLDFGLKEFPEASICGYCDARNLASKRILEKVGLQKIGELIDEGDLCYFYSHLSSRT